MEEEKRKKEKKTGASIIIVPIIPFYSKGRPPLSSSSLENQENTFKRNLEKGVEMKVKVVEAKFQEEKLKLQQRHDDDVQKILERKNQEIEEMRVQYRLAREAERT